MRKTLQIALVVASIGVIIGAAPLIYGLLSTVLSLDSRGNVETIGVEAYWDSDCTSEVSLVDWGMIEPGDSKNVTIYLKNEGNTTITLSLDTKNWDPPEASSYISLDWSYTGEQIDPDDVIQVVLTLTLSPDISGITSFSFTIAISGSES